MPRFNTTGSAAAAAFRAKGPRRVTPTEWSATDKHNSTLSNSDLTRAGNSGTNNYAIASHRPSDGKYYYEITVDVDAFSRTEIGVASSAFGITGGGSDGRDEFDGPNTIYAYAGGGIWIAGVNTVPGFSTFTASDVICVSLDMVNRQVWLRKNAGNWNNDPSANPANNVGGIALSAIGIGPGQIARVGVGSGVATTQTANFGDTPMTYIPPVGFSVGFGSLV